MMNLEEKIAGELFVRRLQRHKGLVEAQAEHWWNEGKTFEDEISVARADAKQLLFGNNLAIIDKCDNKDCRVCNRTDLHMALVIPLEETDAQVKD